MNKFKTKNYYRELNKDSLCSCDYCRNYYKEVKAAYPELSDGQVKKNMFTAAGRGLDRQPSGIFDSLMGRFKHCLSLRALLSSPTHGI